LLSRYCANSGNRSVLPPPVRGNGPWSLLRDSTTSQRIKRIRMAAAIRRYPCYPLAQSPHQRRTTARTDSSLKSALRCHTRHRSRTSSLPGDDLERTQRSSSSMSVFVNASTELPKSG
jgi:hypothetical protein